MTETATGNLQAQSDSRLSQEYMLPRCPGVLVVVTGSCTEERLFKQTVQSVFEQDYPGRIVVMCPTGGDLEPGLEPRAADGNRLLLEKAVNANRELDADVVLDMARKLHASVEFVALLRCGEKPPPSWLRSLLRSQESFDADLVVGPVKAVFDEPPLDWILAEGLFDRLGAWRDPLRRGPAHDNILMRSDVFQDLTLLAANAPGADKLDRIDYSLRAEALGLVSIWANDAIVFDSVPENRMREASLLDWEFSRAYAKSRARSLAGASRVREAMLRAWALGLLLAGAANSRVGGFDRDRLLRGRLLVARAKGTMAGCSRDVSCGS